MTDKNVFCCMMTDDGKCAILNVKRCGGEKCAFKRSGSELEASDIRWRSYI